MAKFTIEVDSDKVSDGFHTVSELYNHRCHLFVALMRSNPTISWRAKLHHDGTSFGDWFIAGMDLPTGAITYHLPLWMWDMLDGRAIKTMDRAPEWDGHTPDDVVKRLAEWSQFNWRSPKINHPWRLFGDELAALLIREDLYNILPLYGVETEYRGGILRRNDAVPMYKNDQPIGTLLCDHEVAAQAETIGDIAMGFRELLMKRHPGKWEQFAGQIFADSVVGCVRLVYGIKEE